MSNTKDQNHFPKHIGIIMDGNRRWANMRGLSSFFGHKKGAEALKKIIIQSNKMNISELSVFAFSTENWSRAKKETDDLQYLFERFIKSEIAEINMAKIKIKIIGTFSMGTLEKYLKMQK